MMATDECFIGIFGALRRHPWVDVDTLDADPYSLFFAYGELLGWATATNDPQDRAQLWGIHEAGGQWSDTPEGADTNLLWVQVGLTDWAKQHGLPVAQLGACAEKVLDRVGDVSLSGLQLIVPIGKAPAPWPRSMLHMLETADRSTRRVVQVEIEGGEDDTCIQHATQIVDELARATTSDSIRVLTGATSVLSSSPPLLDEPAGMDRAAWLGPSARRITTELAVAAEFSIEIGCHLAAHIARASQIAGVRQPIAISLRRAGVSEIGG